MNEEDRRVKKTKRALQNALAELMLHKSLRHITVQELADAADVHRVTFYSHYHDVYDLYEQIEMQVLSELDNITKEDPLHLYAGTYEDIVEYIHSNQSLFYILLCDEENSTFKNKICELFERKYLFIWLFEDNVGKITEEMKLLTTYYIHGCIAVFAMWAKDGFSIPKDEIIRLMHKLDLNFENMINL